MRGGFSADGKDHGAEIMEGFASYQLPWSLRSKGGWGVSTEVALTAGTLSSGDDRGFVGSLGPAFDIGNPNSLELDLGVSIAILSRDRFGGRDYNGIQQFISHAGVIYHFTPAFALSYRFQHMSNAGLNGGINPGLNMHLFGVNWYPGR
ncbi:acyloxyacyl hydrolase [Geomonas anaerohicana]|uniref:acyloxyacyl hydrolase n=1 Tax=Geomonas anaerohicana TaxID=2798583 RepID=UPI002E2BB670|nr:acyloxyacyl hydrolase [Geomonas anaerohicana]